MHWRALKYFWNFFDLREGWSSYPDKENDSDIAFEANSFFSFFLDAYAAFPNWKRDPRTFLNTGFSERLYIFW